MTLSDKVKEIIEHGQSAPLIGFAHCRCTEGEKTELETQAKRLKVPKATLVRAGLVLVLAEISAR